MKKNHTPRNNEPLYVKGQMLKSLEQPSQPIYKGRVFSVSRKLGGGWRYTLIVEGSNGHMRVFDENQVKPA